MASDDFKKAVKLQEELLKAQLRVVRGILRECDDTLRDKESSYKKRKSKISYIKDILISAQHPLHISEIIKRAADEFGVVLERDSMVSALTKKVKRGDTFVRIQPNTFGLIRYGEKNNANSQQSD